MSCSSERYDNAEPKYVLNHPHLRWVSTNPTFAANVPGVIKVGSLQWPIAKIEIPAYNGTITQIGKFQTNTNSVFYWDPIRNAEITYTGTFDVLVCQATCANGGSGPCKLIPFR